jgi:hypothetical protein
MGSMGFGPISVLKLGWVICGLLLLENHGPRGTWQKNLQNLDSIELERGSKGSNAFKSTKAEVSI